MLHACHMREIAVLDYNSGINAARRDGEKQGIAIGEQRGEQKGIAIGEQKAQTEYVLKLFRKGMSIDEISKYTDLSVDEVNNILNDSKAL
jgi:predicted transposase/invertase (TIGR01784 family)